MDEKRFLHFRPAGKDIINTVKRNACKQQTTDKGFFESNDRNPAPADQCDEIADKNDGKAHGIIQILKQLIRRLYKKTECVQEEIELISPLSHPP